MTQKVHDHDEALESLSSAVAGAAAFFGAADERLSDGYQTAREVLSHLVFWHREYVCIAWSLATGRRHWLRSGSFASLNARAHREYRATPVPVLVDCLLHRQKQLVKALRRVPDWSLDFPVKEGGCYCSVAERVSGIEAHIRSHVARLQAAARQRAAPGIPAVALAGRMAAGRPARHRPGPHLWPAVSATRRP